MGEEAGFEERPLIDGNGWGERRSLYSTNPERDMVVGLLADPEFGEGAGR